MIPWGHFYEKFSQFIYFNNKKAYSSEVCKSDSQIYYIIEV